MKSRPGPLLVVDDTEANRDMLSRRLQRLGYHVVLAADGSEALHVIERQHVALVLLDVEMPGMSGIEVLSTLRTRYSPIELPVIMVTARQQREDIIQALTLGANDYVTKPIDMPIAAARIQTQLSLRQAESALRESEERYALAARGANDGLWDWNLATGEVYFSTRWKLMLGGEEQEIGSSPDEWFDRIHPEEIARVRAEVDQHLADSTPQFESEHRLRHSDGTYRWMLVRGLAIRDPLGRPTRFAGSLTDITEGKVSDPLTGLPNRILFLDRLGRAMERRRRHSDSLYAVLFLDLDRFKMVNDSLGHVIGDQLLIAIARRLQRCLRATDRSHDVDGAHTIARLGGDEFTILLDDITEIGDAMRVADRIQKTLAMPFNLDGHEVFTSASVGIAVGVREYETPDAVLRDADTALYRAKALGKARYEVFDAEMRDRAVARLRLDTDLRRAIERQDFQLYYQPIVSLTRNRIEGFEALLRWPHWDRGLVYPADFIPVAEETGLILPMGWWVLAEACRQLAAWQSTVPIGTPLTMAVNLSSKQFVQSDLVPQIERVLAQTGVGASQLKLEITESTIIDNTESMIGLLLQLKALGIQIAIDDFGTGYSSLSYLHRLPIDSLKIDRSFVSCMTQDSGEIVRAIVGLAHNLGLDVIAEGVETVEQLEELRALGCEFGQGYLFSKPVKGCDVDALLAPEPGTREVSGKRSPDASYTPATPSNRHLPTARKTRRASASRRRCRPPESLRAQS
ncbi:MAG TPA: EAL domain-containing protein [Vicinamibacterales bacterium]|nr:EAL domain-containing protein [Vicinamibacterales bacterium]